MAVFFSTTTPTAAALIPFVSACSFLLLLLLLPAVAALSFDYPTFGPEDQATIRVEGDAYISSGWIDVTANRVSSIGHSMGRASYKSQPMLLWDGATGEVASFTTRFDFVIDPQPAYGGINNKGAGMAFFLAAAYPSALPSNPYAYDLALTNQSAGAVATGDARFVAVEFDTFNDTAALDPDTTYDHLGINVNSIRSVATRVLPSFSLVGNMTAEVAYSNVTGVLEVMLWLGDGRDASYNLSHVVDLKAALPENVSVGFSASTSTSVELHRLRSWYFSSSLEPKPAAAAPTAPPTPLPPPLTVTVPPPPPSPTTSTSSGSAGLAGGVTAGATVGASLFLALLLAAASLFARRRRRSIREEASEGGGGESDDDGVEPIVEIEMGAGPRRFPYHELAAATRSFAPEEKLGQGGFGAVYRGYLRANDSGTNNGGLPVVPVAIKRFAKESSKQGRKEFASEIKVISRLRHRNLVQLVGWCHGRDELLLVYELVPNRSLDVHLHGGAAGGGTFLAWPVRFRVVLGLGSALLYLHEEWEQCVVHRDVKPSNVMLDESFGAKLGDFGLARLIDHAVGMQTMTAVSGTPGYVDPECVITGQASAESDVYSFGVVALEVASGRRPMSLLDGAASGGVFRLVEWAWDLYGLGDALAVVDERLRAGDGYDAAQAERVVAVGIWCAHPDPRARPSIRDAMAALQSRAPVPPLPAKMPVATYAAPVGLFSSSRLTQSSSTTTTTSHTSSSSVSSTSTGSKDSSSLLKHQY